MKIKSSLSAATDLEETAIEEATAKDQKQGWILSDFKPAALVLYFIFKYLKSGPGLACLFLFFLVNIMTEAIGETHLETLPGSPGCFICDNNGSNPRSLRLKIMWDEAGRQVRIAFQPDQSWCGYSEVVHGGLVASVMDEAMAWAVKQALGQWAFTADFHLRYKKPLAPGQHYEVRAEAEEGNSRKITARARVLDCDGRVTAQAEAIFLPGGRLARPRTAAAQP